LQLDTAVDVAAK